jgi:hypothetical protein
MKLRITLAALVLGLVCGDRRFVGIARADAPAVEHPYPGIACHTEVRKNPAERLYWATIDLTDPHVSLHVSPAGPDPDGDGKWQTSLMPPTAVARREGFELTVNGDFFVVPKPEGPTTQQPQQKPAATAPAPGYRAAMWASVVGPAATDGRGWAGAEKPRPCLIVKTSGQVTIERRAKARADDAQVIAGNFLLVKDGQVVAHDDPARHPRTVVGLDAGGKHLTILVVDGRRPGAAEGMTYAELSKEMIDAGCDRALNLDGGGSSVMVLRAGDRYEIRNHPSNESERPVANVLGIDVKDAK